MQSARNIALAYIVVLSTIAGVTAPIAATDSQSPQGDGPQAFFIYSPQSPNTNQTVTLDAHPSYSQNQSIEEYRWYYEKAGGREQATGRTINISWTEKGDYNVTLIVTDSSGRVDGRTRQISVTEGQVESKANNPLINGRRGAYRILTNNDPLRKSYGEFNNSWNVPSGTFQQRVVNGNVSTMRIDGRSLSVLQSRAWGQLTDTYRETLSEPVLLPTANNYRTFDYDAIIREVNNPDVREILFLNFSATGEEIQHTGPDKQVWALTTTRPGYRRLVNANVTRKQNPAGSPVKFKITNKDEVKIFDGDPITYDEFNRRSVNRTFSDVGRNISQIVLANGSSRYPLGSASVATEYQGNKKVIRDQYAATARITEGAIYANYWLVNPAGINVTVLNDYRTKIPAYYENTTRCSWTTCENGNCTTSYGNTTRYERYEYINHSSTVKLWHNDTYYESEGNRFFFNISNPDRGAIIPYSRVSLTMEHTYGAESTCPDSSWNETEIVSVNNTYDSSGAAIKPASADELNITVYILNKGENEKALHVGVAGNQRPSVNPLEKIAFTATGPPDVTKRFMVRTPWTFIPQALYKLVRWRGQGSSHLVIPHPAMDETPNYVHRDYLDANSYRFESRNILFETDNTVVGQRFEGVTLKPKINDTIGDVRLYRFFGGTINAMPGNYELNNPRAWATDIYGNNFSVDIVRRTYIDTELKLETGGGKVTGKLVSESGDGLANRTLTLNGMKNETVTTDKTGGFVAVVSNNSTSVSISFSGTPFHQEELLYFESETEQLVTAKNTINIITAPVGYVGQIITNLFMIAEWLAFGLVCLWWAKTAKD